MKNLVLVGMMGSGKSTVGRLLAEQMNLKFIDSDQLIEVDEGCSISEMFANRGEAYFRRLESKKIKTLSLEESQVISTGGGVVLDEKNIKNLKVNGIIIYLEGDVETLFRRLNKGSSNRPLLDDVDLKTKIYDLLDLRRALYDSAATFTVELACKSPQVLVREIMDKYCNF